MGDGIVITELAKGVHWVGVVDWAIKHFHGFELSTHRGTTYNSYLIQDFYKWETA